MRKIFNNKIDDMVHLQFKKFGIGEFKDRAVIVSKKSKEKFSINTSHEYANEFVRFLAEKLGRSETHVTGIVVSIRNLDGELDFLNKKQFMGVKQYIIDKEMTGTKILDLCNKLSSSFIGLSFSVGNSVLKIKPKAPKSSKPSTKGENNSKINFCKLITNDFEIVKSLIFDDEARDFNKIEISHDFIINEIVINDELKQEKDFAKIKEMAKRKGKIIRKLNIDGKNFVKEKEFVA